MVTKPIPRRDYSEYTTIPHGTYSGYKYHMCNCKPCTTAKNKKNSQYEARRRRRKSPNRYEYLGEYCAKVS
jgi:hypothetical protein